MGIRGGWTPSPAFYVNPTPELDRHRSTSIAGADMFPDEVEGPLALAEDCSLSSDPAREVIARVADSMFRWRTIAGQNGVAEREIRMMSEAVDPRAELIAKESNA